MDGIEGGCSNHLISTFILNSDNTIIITENSEWRNDYLTESSYSFDNGELTSLSLAFTDLICGNACEYDMEISASNIEWTQPLIYTIESMYLDKATTTVTSDDNPSFGGCMGPFVFYYRD